MEWQRQQHTGSAARPGPGTSETLEVGVGSGQDNGSSNHRNSGLDLRHEAPPGIFGTRAPARCPRLPVAHLVSPPPSLYVGPPGPRRPLGLPGRPARAGFKDSSCGPQPLATGPRRTGARRPHAQVQPSEPPAEGRESGTLLSCLRRAQGSLRIWARGHLLRDSGAWELSWPGC